MTRSLEDLVDDVAQHVINRPEMDAEDWEKCVALKGLLATGYEDEAREFVDRAIETQTSHGHYSYGSPEPLLEGELPAGQMVPSLPASLAYPILELYERTGDDEYLDSVHDQFDGLLADSPRTQDGTVAFSTDVANRGIELWVDSIYLMCPWLVQYGQLADEDEPIEEAVQHIEEQRHRLRDDDTGLYRHIWRESPNTYPESTFWARGNGWALAGFLDVLDYLPEDHEAYDEVESLFLENASAILELQDDSGLWHNILDDEYDRLEASGTLRFAYAFKRGVEQGLLSDEYEEAAEAGMEVCKDLVDESGAVDRVVVPPGGPEVPFGTTSYGQGWFLLAADQFL